MSCQVEVWEVASIMVLAESVGSEEEARRGSVNAGWKGREGERG